MRFGKADFCVLVVILACLAYLYLTEDDNNHWKPTAEFSDKFDAEAAEESVVNSVRSSCQNVFVLDLTYSEIPAVPIDYSKGDDILNALFSVSL